MYSIEAEILINARSSTVWDIITDAGNYAVWDSGITQIQGDLCNGSAIRIRTVAGGQRKYRLRVEQLSGEVMTWNCRLPFGLFAGVRTFTLTEEAGLTLLRVRQELNGPLLALFRNRMPDAGRSPLDFVRAVKRRAEILG